MKKILSVIFILSMAVNTMAQRPNYAEDVATIIYTKCTGCHRPGEIGPMPFTNYQEVYANAFTIAHSTQIKYMPPWSPDPAYNTFLDERLLSAQEIQTIQDWVANGAPRGNPSLEPALPIFPIGSQLGTPDLVLSWAQAYTHTGNNQDQYQVFVIPSTVTTDKDIAAIEFRPQNKNIAHHAIFALDTTGTARTKDAATPEYGYEGFGGFGINNVIDINWTAWVPGTTPRFSPTGIGKKLYKNADILVQMHYGPTSISQTDSSVINIFYSKTPISRYVYTAPFIQPGNLVNGPFFIGANQVKTFHSVYNVSIDASIISIAPHNHLIGRSWLSYAVTATGDTIHLVKINDWDFNWQGSYTYPKLLKIPAGSVIHTFATYDNTTNNPYNPNNPPRAMTWGEGTNDEMFLVYLSIIPYMAGDENIALANLNQNGIIAAQHKIFPIYPNPIRKGIAHISFELDKADNVSLTITDICGKIVEHAMPNQLLPQGKHSFEFDVKNFKAGTYLVNLKTKNGFTQGQRLIVAD